MQMSDWLTAFRRRVYATRNQRTRNRRRFRRSRSAFAADIRVIEALESRIMLAASTLPMQSAVRRVIDRPPSVTAPGHVSLDENGTFTFSGSHRISVADVDSDGQPEQLT